MSKAADHIVLKIVNNVCHEAIEEDLVQKLVQAELKSFNWHQLNKNNHSHYNYIIYFAFDTIFVNIISLAANVVLCM